MAHLITTISKYLILVFMAFYVVNCFAYLLARDGARRVKVLNKQIWYIFVIHFLCHVCLLINLRKPAIAIYYLVEILIAIVYIVSFHGAYKKASRLLTNNIAFLMLIGYTILLRLSEKLAMRQFILASAGLLFSAFIPMILGKLKNMKNWNAFYAIFGIAFLLLVFVPGVGETINGSRNWIHVGPVSLQPMEFVKILFVLFCASSLVKVRTMKQLIANAAVALLFMLVLVGEKDLGAFVIFYITYFMMVYLATSRPVFMLGGIALGVLATVIGMALFRTTLFSHVVVRIHAWQDPFRYQQTDGYQICESLFGIGTGGFAGSGLGKGMPYLIPVAESDFIFSAICEELGVIFGLALILIYVSSFLAMLNIAMKCTSPFYKYVTFGIAVTYIVQVLLNIGGVTRFIPSTGVTLPLVSYGISSVFSTLIMFSIVQYTYIQVDREADKVKHEKEEITETVRARLLSAAGSGNVSGVPGLSGAGEGETAEKQN